MYLSVVAMYLSVVPMYLSVDTMYLSVVTMYLSVVAMYLSVVNRYLSDVAMYLSVVAISTCLLSEPMLGLRETLVSDGVGTTIDAGRWRMSAVMEWLFSMTGLPKTEETSFSGFFLLSEAWWDSYDSLRIRSCKGELKKLLLISSSSKLWLSSTGKYRHTDKVNSCYAGQIKKTCLVKYHSIYAVICNFELCSWIGLAYWYINRKVWL